MTYSASMRVWRGDESCGELREFTVEVNEGEVVLDVILRLQQRRHRISQCAGIAKLASADPARPRSTANRD